MTLVAEITPSRDALLTERERARFWEKVRKTDSCWIWTRSLTLNGYGQIGLRRHHRLVHRVAYEALKGPIPAGLDIDHLCRNTRCVNPDHLEPVTRSENIRRLPRSSAPCKRNHPMSAFAIQTRTNGRQYRRCRLCNRINFKAAYYKQKTTRQDEATE